MSLALGPVARLSTRALYRNSSSATTWERKIILSIEGQKEIKFWAEEFDSCHGAPIWKRAPKIDVITCSDAGESSWGGGGGRRGLLRAGGWDNCERTVVKRTKRDKFNLERTHGNLPCSSRIYQTPKGRTIKHCTDNQNTERLLVIGSRKQHLHQLAINIYKICKDNSIILIPEWISREANWLSVQLSKDIDHDDCMLNTSIFAAFDILRGPHTVDRFASFRSRQIPRFNSKLLSPATEGIDAFTISWKNENNCLLPPPAFFLRF